MAKVEVKSTSLVPMASNESSISRMELTPWDLRFLLFDPIQKGLLFYNPESKQLQNITNIIDHLKNSLSRTLEFFPPLAGRLSTVRNDDNTSFFFVDCNNQGAEFTYAVARDVSVSDIMEAKYTPEIVSNFFTLNGVLNFKGTSTPLFGVQVTECVDGFFIGCSANHVVVDGTSFWHFINSWSEISRGLGKISNTPIFERNFPNNVKRVPVPQLEKYMFPEINPPQLLERVFHFSKESLAKLKAKANAEAGAVKLSTLQVVSAHLLRSVVRCRRNLLHTVHNNLLNSQEVIYIYLAIGARGRIPLPEGYFGNAVYACRAGISEEGLLQNGLGYAGLKINELVNKQTREGAFKFVEDWIKEPRLSRISGTTFVISSSPFFNIYGNDFGWGKPIALKSGNAKILWEHEGSFCTHIRRYECRSLLSAGDNASIGK